MFKTHNFLLRSHFSKPGQDLLNLDFLGSTSAASTPTGANYNIELPSPLSPQTEINWNSAQSSAATTPSSSKRALSSIKFIYLVWAALYNGLNKPCYI